MVIYALYLQAVGWIKVLGVFCPGERSESTFINTVLHMDILVDSA